MFNPLLVFLCASTLAFKCHAALDPAFAGGDVAFEKRTLRRRENRLQIRDELYEENQADPLSPPSTDPSLSGGVDDPDPDADFGTWYPSDLDPNRASLEKRARRKNSYELHARQFDFDLGDTTYNITFSGCAARGNTPLGTWTFENLTVGKGVTWAQINDDARANKHKFGSVANALDAGINRNLLAFNNDWDSILGKWTQDDIGAISSDTIETLDSDLESSQSYDNYWETRGKVELRRLQQEEGFVPDRRTVALTIFSSAATFGIIAGFSVSGAYATNQNITWNTFQGAVAATCVFWAVGLAGWIALPGVRRAVNRLSASGALAVVRERGERVINDVRGVGFEGSQTDPGNSAVASEVTYPVMSGEMISPPATPLSAIGQVHDWFGNPANDHGIELQSIQIVSDGASQALSQSNVILDTCPNV